MQPATSGATDADATTLRAQWPEWRIWYGYGEWVAWWTNKNDQQGLAITVRDPTLDGLAEMIHRLARGDAA